MFVSDRIVLQGEFAVLKGGEEDSYIKSTAALSCNIFTIYDSEKKVGAVCHADDYTSVADAMDQISTVLRERFQAPLSPSRSSNFKAKVYGGSKDPVSKEKQKKILTILRKVNVNTEVLSKPLEANPTEAEMNQRSQVALNVRTGEVILIDPARRDNNLRTFQRREYKRLNDFLDDRYPRSQVNANDIPDSLTLESNREEKDIPNYSSMTEIERNVSELGWETNRQEPITVEKLIEKMKGLTAHLNELEDIMQKEDFTLLLRKVSMLPEELPLLTFLLEHRFMLDIDLNAAGKKGGTALEIATKFKNQQAIDLLNQYL